MELNFRYVRELEIVEIYRSNPVIFQNNLCNLLRVRARLVEKQYSLYKLHANYGRVFSEWSAIEREMGDGLQVFRIQYAIRSL